MLCSHTLWKIKQREYAFPACVALNREVTPPSTLAACTRTNVTETDSARHSVNGRIYLTCTQWRHENNESVVHFRGALFTGFPPSPWEPFSYFLAVYCRNTATFHSHRFSVPLKSFYMKSLSSVVGIHSSLRYEMAWNAHFKTAVNFSICARFNAFLFRIYFWGST